ncbi:MAG: ubiquitin-binding protein [Pelagibacteraceae bacterium]|nr:ubiquitin-binding protein [Pelagibacteraceae bacterium]
MKELITAIGLLFFIEGLFLAIIPSRIKNILELIKKTPESKLRTLGVVFLIIGFLIIWYIKN